MSADSGLAATSRGIERLMFALYRLCLAGSLSLLGLMITCILIQIVARYLLAIPPAWTEELARYAMVWCAMLGASCAYYLRAEPTLSRGITTLSRGAALFKQTLETLAIGLFSWPVLAYGPATLVRLASRETETLGVSFALPLSAVPLGFGLLLTLAVLRWVLAVLALPAYESDYPPPTQ
ncbi:MAG TPA: hypothetical protein DD459_00960 [Halieaceae bacterium]|nr:hypothetical protein [Halieaceae bacterium]|tara:strand:+ start:11467 stop:12006 length:540 start_codon:yes stop_codon:yes gene_type:complete